MQPLRHFSRAFTEKGPAGASDVLSKTADCAKEATTSSGESARAIMSSARPLFHLSLRLRPELCSLDIPVMTTPTLTPDALGLSAFGFGN